MGPSSQPDHSRTNGQLHVLVVDDEAELTEALADVLELNDIIVTVANSGEEALSRLQAETFDCVVMDIMMPGMNGVETMKRARELAPGTIMMLMTAYSVDELIDEAKREGALAILKKPLEVDSFLTFLSQFKDRSSILVVDDDTDLCHTLQETLSPRGYRTFVANNAAEAIAAASLNRYEVVLVNQDTQSRNGVETIIAVRELDPRAVFVLLSSCVDVAHAVNSRVEPESLIPLTKPFELDSIVALLEQIRFHKLRQALREQRIQMN
jgi:DNA-binding NtrC family response regulator